MEIQASMEVGGVGVKFLQTGSRSSIVGAGMATARDRHYYMRSALDACLVVVGVAPAMQKKDGYPQFLGGRHMFASDLGRGMIDHALVGTEGT